MSDLKICINASNLHCGGGVQVASSFIYELSLLHDLPENITCLVSSEVAKNLHQVGCDISKFFVYEIYDTFGVSSLWSGFLKKLKNFDVIFTVFGPLYVVGLKAINIVGFAQPWIIYPDNELYRKMSSYERFKIRLKFQIQSVFFRKADVVVVELEHVKKRLTALGVYPENSIKVVNNCLSSLYMQPEKWLHVNVDIIDNSFSIGFVGRDYPHKNTDLLPEVKQILSNKYGLEVNFYVTLNDFEWASKSDSFRRLIFNAGSLTVAQCPYFYEKMDAIIFPSLLECFSATPLEAMAMKKPLFASDRGFVRDVCGDYAMYFDPMNAESAAEIIAEYIKNRSPTDEHVRLIAARDHVIGYSNAHQRAVEYLHIALEANLQRNQNGGAF